MIRQSGFHRWRCFAPSFIVLRQCTMRTDAIVNRKIQAKSRFVVRPLLAERIRKTSEATILHPHGQVMSLNMGRADFRRIGFAAANRLDSAGYFTRRVAMIVFLGARFRRRCHAALLGSVASKASWMAVSDGASRSAAQAAASEVIRLAA
jgi:hypothetical protein